MKPKLTAFLSASAEPNDKQIVEWFSNLLKKSKVEPIFATLLPEPRPPQEKIRDLIKKADMFVGILTKREKIEGKNLWRGPDWVQNEIAIAYALKKPIAIFTEKEVQIDRSIGQYCADCVLFDRENLASVRKQAQRYIDALRERVGKPTYTQVEEDEIGGTIVDRVDEGVLEYTIYKMARIVLLRRFGRLDISLKRFYAVSLFILLVLSYFVYDSLFGFKLIGYTGLAVVLAVLIIMVSVLYIAGVTRCSKCRSYFSERQKPVTYADVQRFPNLPKNLRLLKFVCEACGNVRYDTKEREPTT